MTSQTYSKTQLDSLLAGKAATNAIPTLAAVATTGAYADLTGTPVIPTTAAAVGAEPAGTAAAAIATLVGGASTALDTLAEIDTQLAADEGSAAALTALVGQKAPLASPAFTGTPTIGGTAVAKTSDVAAAIAAQATADSATYAPLRKARSARTLAGFSGAYTPFPGWATVRPGLSTANPTDLGLTNPVNVPLGVTPSTTIQGAITADPCLVHGPVAFSVDSGGKVTAAQPHGTTADPITYEWVTDSPWFAIVGSFNTVGFSLYVDNELVSAADGNPGFNAAQVSVNWGGVRAFRHYRLESGDGFAVSKFVANVADTFYAPKITSRITAAVIGDSYSQWFHGWQYVSTRLLGWDVAANSTDGGTGYITAGAGQPFSARVPDVVAANPDVIVVAGGINDPVTGLQAGATAVLAALRTGLPNALIVVVGPWCPPSATYTEQAAKYAAIQAAVAATSNSIFIDPHTWVTGTGNTSNLMNDGNADLFIGPDNVHPSTAGQQYLGARVAEAVRAALPY